MNMMLNHYVNGTLFSSSITYTLMYPAAPPSTCRDHALSKELSRMAST